MFEFCMLLIGFCNKGGLYSLYPMYDYILYHSLVSDHRPLIDTLVDAFHDLHEDHQYIEESGRLSNTCDIDDLE